MLTYAAVCCRLLYVSSYCRTCTNWELAKMGAHLSSDTQVPIKMMISSIMSSSLRPVSIRQHTSAYVSIRRRMFRISSIMSSSLRPVSIRQHTSADTSVSVNIRQHTSAYAKHTLR